MTVAYSPVRELIQKERLKDMDRKQKAAVSQSRGEESGTRAEHEEREITLMPLNMEDMRLAKNQLPVASIRAYIKEPIMPRFVHVGSVGVTRIGRLGLDLSKQSLTVRLNKELDYILTFKLKEALKSYELVFDAVYTPRSTRLLREAEEVGAIVVSGVEMFIRQAIGQFNLFTGEGTTGVVDYTYYEDMTCTADGGQ